MLSRLFTVPQGLIIAALWSLAFNPECRAQTSLRVSPPAIALDNPEATQQALVRSSTLPKDLTRIATFQIVDPQIASVDGTGLVQPKAEGKTVLIVRHEKDEVRVPVDVTGLKTPAPVAFETEVMPILSRAGCNAGGCHGKAEGKNGFKLSIFGFDPAADFEALLMEGRGRRVFPAAPDSSLMLLKATGQVAHGGGRRMTTDSLHYRRLRRWIAEGAAGPAIEGGAEIKSIEVEPREQILTLYGSQQLRVTAIDGSGRKRCVTLDAQYDSNAPTILKVDARGTVRANDLPGQAAILVRYLGQVTVCRITIPRTDVAGSGAKRPLLARPPEANFIDRLAWDHLIRLGIPPSELADDATFLRRVFLDTIGTLPTAVEARAFLADTRSNRRAMMIDQLLSRPEYADYWAMKWADVLRVDRDAITPAGAVAVTRWLRKQFAENRPYDEFVRGIVTARGPIADEGPAAIYKALATPEDLSRSFSQLFLGIRIQCAQCHHHPSDKWGQEDYYALAGFFTGIGHKTPAGGGGEFIFSQKGTELPHPRTKKPVPARALGAAPVDFTDTPDRRTVLAQWITASENPYFSRALANRLWSHYFGRGLVEPLDDLRATNPAVNEPLLDELAKHLLAQKYDVKSFTRTVLNSRLYQLGGISSPTMSAAIGGGRPALDDQNFSHAQPRAIPAEVLLDAICQATGVPEKYNGWPTGYRAIQIWDNRMPSYFFRIFGRPVRASVCECERSSEPSVAQALHLMNSEEIMSKLRSRQGTARKLAQSKLAPREIIDELYLCTLSRFPNDAERTLMLGVFSEAGDDRQSAVEDVLWALLNTRSFVYNH